MKPSRKDLKIMSEGLRELEAIQEILSKDAKFLGQEFDEEDGQIMRRAYVRAVFAHIEGTTFRMKQAALKSSGMFDVALSEAEIALIEETTYELKDNGEIKIQPKFLKFQSNLRFAFKVFARVFKGSYELNVRDNGWECLGKAFAFRNRLVHPKHLDDLTVNDEELKISLKAYLWWKENMSALIKDATDAFDEYVESLGVQKFRD